ncbi:MAG: hypothetical protein HYX84_01845 [Chloroflexi bacterium]|nr:hypothetical protein [Chloroflexota bacterium]
MKQKQMFDAFYWAILILVTSQVLAFYISFREKVFFEENRIVSPELSVGVPLIYFFSAAAVLGIILFLIPVSRLKIVLRFLYAFLFSWSIFIAFAFSVPTPAAILLAVIPALVWIVRPVIWLHDLLMVSSMSAAGAVFGFLFAPWTFMVFMLIIAVYDIAAVRFGYMLWLAGKLSEGDTLPAFVIPKQLSQWNQSLRKARIDGEVESEFSILGGGDIALPLVLTVSVFFSDGFANALVMGGFSVIGLSGAYWIQRFLLNGKPMPAIPPIAAACLIGLLTLRFLL